MKRENNKVVSKVVSKGLYKYHCSCLYRDNAYGLIWACYGVLI